MIKLFAERLHWQGFSVHPRLLARHGGGALDGHPVSTHFHDDPALLGCVALCGAAGAARVVASVEHEFAVSLGLHAERQRTSGAFEHLKEKLHDEHFCLRRK